MAGAVRRLYDAYLKRAPRQSRSRIVVEAILVAALERVETTGDEDSVTLQDVAQRAGVAIGSLYDYFRDRESILATLTAKATEENRLAFERLLERTRSMSVTESVEAIIDHALATYVPSRKMARMYMRVAHAAGLMPLVAASMESFRVTLAAALRERSDLRITDYDAAAFVLTNGVMGAIHTLVWNDEDPVEKGRIRASLIDLFSRYLSGTSTS
jgi:AcrR family transcriptional regulator